MGNTSSLWDVTCQNVTAWTWRVRELSVAVNLGASEAIPGARGTRSALAGSSSRAERVVVGMRHSWCCLGSRGFTRGFRQLRLHLVGSS